LLAIELEPEDVGRELAGLLDGHAADRSERVGHTRPLRRARHGGVRARPHQSRPAHGRDPDRGRVAAAEQLHIDRRQ
jgi:hypothetical protein